MIYSTTWWWFSDEAEQPHGPFETKEDAEEASALYDHTLERNLSEKEATRLKQLYSFYREQKTAFE